MKLPNPKTKLKNSILLSAVHFYRKGHPPTQISLSDIQPPFSNLPKGYFSGLYGYKSHLDGLSDARVYADVHSRAMLVVDITVQLSTPVIPGTTSHATLGQSEFIDLDRRISRPLIDELAGMWQKWLGETAVQQAATLYDWNYPEQFIPHRIDWVIRLFKEWGGIKLIVHPGFAFYSTNLLKFGTFKLGDLVIVSAAVRSMPNIEVLL